MILSTRETVLTLLTNGRETTGSRNKTLVTGISLKSQLVDTILDTRDIGMIVCF